MIDDGMTIIASATGDENNHALSVVRISGSFNLENFQPFFSKKINSIEPRKIYLTHLLENEQIIDQICFVFFKSPASYTGENLLELHIHGSQLNVKRVLDLFIKNKIARLAKPGEFSFRALKNGKMNVSQLEGLDLFINAHTPFALEQGMSLLNGELQKNYLEMLENFKRHKTSLEIMIDFGDDVGEEKARAEFISSFEVFFTHLENLKRRTEVSTSSLINPEIVLVGPPNAGKSTFFNFLLKEDRAIVSPTAGTTRDYISEAINFKGVQYRLIDTAGIRETRDSVEAKGIEFSINKLQKAFFKVVLINPFDLLEENSLNKIEFDLIIFTHSDQKNFEDQKNHFKKIYKLQFNQEISANLLSGSMVLWDQLENTVNSKYLRVVRRKPVLIERQKSLISMAYSEACLYKQKTTIEEDVAVLSHELNSMGHCLSELIGIVSSNEILDNLFHNFCIGK